jgi:predicted RNA-binding protein with PIN domain
VFDAAEAPPGLPRVVMHNGMTVRYASDYDDADALIEELIAANNVPRSLLVVSSDHRLQRAARRRRAPFVDSDVWFAEAARRNRSSRSRLSEPQSPSRAVSLTAEEIAYWLAEFDDAALDGESSGPGGSKDANFADPFPPGYGEDLLD